MNSSVHHDININHDIKVVVYDKNEVVDTSQDQSLIENETEESDGEMTTEILFTLMSFIIFYIAAAKSINESINPPMSILVASSAAGILTFALLLLVRKFSS
ncbi:hypothetical protein NPIL_517531 [Nephila pilipes]|uniref:Uncharacterized protein n=1 Tax=Nephila pilipes TaxID=299642 RepID=A0A8X6UTQ3_NEPPI|nr:hypothetical protein NPIL_517531 [Nephila pilipes]